jgi:hypothetical protein
MAATSALPDGIDRQFWKTGGWSVEKCAIEARTREAEQRCRARTERPPSYCRQLLRDLRESDAMWLALRKHLTEGDAQYILEVLKEHSGWRDVKKSEDEVLRKEYLRLFDECKFYNPAWESTAMKQRRERAQRAEASEDAVADAQEF